MRTSARKLMGGGKLVLALAILMIAVSIGNAQVTNGPVPVPLQHWCDLHDYTQHTDSYFTLSAQQGGTYNLQFIVVQENVWPSYMVFFTDAHTEAYLGSAGPFTATTPKCEGATTVHLAGGHDYRMHIEYAVGGGHHASGVIAQATIFYTCNSQ